jgi:hypothetical protein
MTWTSKIGLIIIDKRLIIKCMGYTVRMLMLLRTIQAEPN